MQIIPVIDLKQNLVVHAVRGDRNHYQPIHTVSKLVRNSDIDSVLQGFLQHYPFQTFYIADLDAITGKGNHTALIQQTLARYPALTFWVDNGSQLTNVQPTQANYKTVIGTESQQQAAFISDMDFILSLDFKQQQPAGDMAWFTDARLWPQKVIIMTLNRVGSNAGPEIELLSTLRHQHPDKDLIAAGGVRNNADIETLKQLGISAVLVATALHTGKLVMA